MKENKEKIVAWVTKYALTTGIAKVAGYVSHDISDTLFCYGSHGFAHNKEWHRTPEEAIAHAEEMRLKKIKSLQKKIAELEKLTFKMEL